MIFISHRGNTNSINEDLENTQEYIDLAISKGYEVEIDVWNIDGNLFLGHDEPERPVALDWLRSRKDKLWIHTKNRPALEFFTSIKDGFKFFWHTVEPFILTSNCLIWAHDYEPIEDDSLCIVPLLSLEQVQDAEVREWHAVCTDFPDQCKAKWEAR
jgi:hypothetical protein